MLTPRNVIVVAAALFGILVMASVVSTLSPPDSDGVAADSFGTGREGQRGLYELLGELGIPVERQIAPPAGPPPLDATLLLVAPDLMAVRTEPEPLYRIADWVRAGGRVVVAPDFAEAFEQEQLDQLVEKLQHFDEDILSALGLDGVQAEFMLFGDVPDDSPADDDELVISRVSDSSTGPVADELTELFTLGSALPEITWDDGLDPIWETRIHDAHDDERVLAAGFRQGAGEVVVVSDSTLFSNVTLRRGQNATWLVRLLLDGGRERVVIDEFYHGLSVRGNAWWLLTRPPFAALAVCGLVFLGLWTWRAGVLLGPPVADEVASRRAIGEYIDSMARFFLRSRNATPFVLRELRAGVWRRLAQETGQPPGSTDLDRLVGRLERKDPAWGARVRAAFGACDESTRARGKGADAKRLTAMQLLSAAAARHPADDRIEPETDAAGADNGNTG